MMNTIATTENTADLQMTLSVYSDMHKEVYGMRPSEANWHRVRNLTLAQLEAEMAEMSERISAEIDRETQMEEQAAMELEIAARALSEDNGVSLGTAYRWLMQAEGCGEDELEHFLWRAGLGCGRTAFEMVKTIREAL